SVSARIIHRRAWYPARSQPGKSLVFFDLTVLVDLCCRGRARGESSNDRWPKRQVIAPWAGRARAAGKRRAPDLRRPLRRARRLAAARRRGGLRVSRERDRTLAERS